MAKSGQNSSLFGLRKSGKTSTIYAITRRAKAFSFGTTVIDCQNPAVHARRYGDLLSYIVSEVRKSIGQSKTVPSFGASPIDVSENFFQHMTSVLGQAKGRILLIFDEIENISPGTSATPHWNDQKDALYFWQTLRSFIQSESKNRLSMCLVGTSPRLLELPKIHNIANPVYLFSQKTFIPNLSFDETQEMVKRLGYFMGLEFPPELVSNLFSEYGGHPFFIRQVCSKIHQIASTERPVQVSQKMSYDAQAEFGGQLDVYLREIFEHLEKVYSDEFSLLRSVVRGKIDEINEFGHEAPELIDHLLGYGIIEKCGEDFDIRFGAIRAALNRLFVPDTVESRWGEISERRNRLESDMRVMFFNWAHTIKPAEWHEIIVRNLTKKRYEALASHEPKLLFSRQSSPLYLSDLMMLLKDEMVLPFLQDRRSLVVKNMSLVNGFRIDAHANAIGDDDMTRIRSALDLLESEFLQP